MMSEFAFIYFGDNIFGKYDSVIVKKNLIDCGTSDWIAFSNLNIYPQNLIEEIYMGWSFALFKVGGSIYHSGFLNPECKHISQVIINLRNDKVNHAVCGLRCSFFTSETGKPHFFQNKDIYPILIDKGKNQSKTNCIATEDLFSIELTEDGKVQALNITDSNVSIENLILPLPIKQITCGKEHVILLSTAGTVFSYGFGSHGQLGHGSIDNHNKPVLIEALDGIEIKTIAAGGWHSAAVSCAGDLYMWGWNESGQLGMPCNELQGNTLSIAEIETVCCLPKIVDFDGDDVNVASVSCGSRHTAALTEDNTVWTWGWNGYGQLGHKKFLLSDKPERLSLPKCFLPQKVNCKFWSTLISGCVNM